MIDMSWRRFVWAVFAFAFIFGADKIKDAEKLTRKVTLETENRMTAKNLQGWEESIGERWQLVIEHIAQTSETLLKQLATYVRVGSPDKTCEHCTKDES